MPNPIKYTTGSETLALKKGNFYIGTGDVGKGPSDVTGYYQGPSVPSGGYVIYMNRVGAPGGLAYHSAANNAELIAFTNKLAVQSYTTVNECLDYYSSQSDKTVWGGDISPVITDGLTSFIDFSSTACYPRSGNKIWNLTNTAVGYAQSTTFSTNDGGKITTDGFNDGNANYVGSRINIGTTGGGIDRFGKENNFSIAFWVKYTGGSRIFSTGSAGSGTSDNCVWQFWLDPSLFYWWNSGGGGVNNITASLNTNIPTNLWSYVTITYAYNQSGNNEVKVYRNGSMIGSGSTPTATHSAIDRSGETSLQYTLGGGYYSSCYTLNSSGEFGMFQVYNRTLSESEATTNFNNTKSRFGL